MKVLFSPQRSDDSLDYDFNGETITITHNGQRELFDFSEMPNGRLENVETSLGMNPVISAERVDGEISVSLLYFHKADATEEELFPKWKEVLEDGTLRTIE